jgi:hypothetical protein
MANFKINGVSVKNPSSFKIERYLVTNMERLANAEMVGDLIAKKRKFYFTYDAISGYDLDVILEAIWETDKLFFPVEYLENGVEKSATVYVGSIPTDLHRAGRTTNWVWKNVTFNLIEK